MRQLILNFAYIGLSRFVDFGIPLIVIPYLISVVGGVNYGKYIFAYSLIFYFLNLVQYGFNLTAVRELSINRDKKEKVNSICSKVITTQIYLIVISFFILQLLIYFVPSFNEESLLLQTLFLIVIGDSLFCRWYFQGIDEMRFITIVNLFSKLSYFVFVLFFINKTDDYRYIGLYQSFGYILSGIMAVYIIFGRNRVKYTFVPFSEVFIVLKDGVSAFTTMIVPILYTNTSIFILGIFASPICVMYFDIANKVCRAATSVNTILNQVIYPFTSRNRNNIKSFVLTKRLYLIVGLVITVIMMATSGLVSQIIAPEFISNVQPLIIILSVSPLLLAIRSVYGINYLMANFYDSLYMKIAVSSSLIGLVLALVLIPLFDVYGAAITILTAQLTYAAQCYYYYRKFSKIKHCA